MKIKDGNIAMEDYIVERLQYLMAERSLSRYKLGKITGVTQASLSTVLSKKCAPSINTLDKIIDGFGISASEFFKDDMPNGSAILTSEEREMLELWRKMKHVDKMMVYAYAQGLEAKNRAER